MPNITYLPTEGEPIVTDAMSEMTLMEVALINDVPGIIGMCGGICSCATCHVVVAPDWIARLPEASAEEQEMIAALSHAETGSRLGCQVRVTDDLEGLVVRVAAPE